MLVTTVHHGLPHHRKLFWAPSYDAVVPSAPSLAPEPSGPQYLYLYKEVGDDNLASLTG